MFGPRNNATNNLNNNATPNNGTQKMSENEQLSLSSADVTANTAEQAAQRNAHDMAARAAAAMPRRAPEPSTAMRRTPSETTSERKLIVGKGLSLTGEITSCDVLVVDGKVEAKMADGKLVEITEVGQYRGSVEIENADIAGRFDGDIVVHGRLTIRSTGRVSGSIRYGEIEINAGGQIVGDLQVIGTNVQTNNGFKSAAKATAVGDDDEAVERNEKRKSA